MTEQRKSKALPTPHPHSQPWTATTGHFPPFFEGVQQRYRLIRTSIFPFTEELPHNICLISEDGCPPPHPIPPVWDIYPHNSERFIKWTLKIQTVHPNILGTWNCTEHSDLLSPPSPLTSKVLAGIAHMLASFTAAWIKSLLLEGHSKCGLFGGGA